MAQTLVFGVLLVAPLVYTQALPFLTVKAPEVRIFRTPPPLAPVEATQTSSSATPTRVPSRIFVPREVPKGVARITDVMGEFTNIPLDPGAIAVASGAGDGITLLPPSITTVAPPVAEPIRTVTTNPIVEITKPVRISGGVLAAKLITQIVPKYPTIARQTRVMGTVKLLGIIARDGHVRDLRVIDGPALLRASALDAVSQWVYAPTLLNGQAVEVEAPIEVHFQLN